jgi:transcription elongation factor Elf1
MRRNVGLIWVWVDLSAAVDVYSDWVDACDAVAKEDVEERGGEYASSRPSAGRPPGGRAMAEDEDLDDLIDDEDDDQGYRGEGIVGDGGSSPI